MSQQPASHNNDTETLRDARLAQALKHMPDAHLQPDAQSRNAVLRAALRAVSDAPATPQAAQPSSFHTTGLTRPSVGAQHWRNAWHWLVGRPGQRMPLTGALASLLIASFATVMWYGQDVPDANPERVAVAVTGQSANANKAENTTPSKTQATESVTTAATPATPAATLPPAPPPPALAKKSAAERRDARPQATQLSQMPQMAELPQKSEPAKPQVATAKSASKEMAPAPAAAAPAPVVAAVAAPPPAPAMVAAPSPIAESPARARRDDVAKPGAQVVLDGQRRTLTSAQSEPLLATLRALAWQADSPRKGLDAGNAYGRSGALADIGPLKEPNRAADTATNSVATEAPFTVQTPDGQRWDISPDSVRSSMAGIVRTSPLTRAQWLQLRALATPTMPPGRF